MGLGGGGMSLRVKPTKPAALKHFKDHFPFLDDDGMDKVSAMRPFDCLMATDAKNAIMGQAVLGPTHIMFVGKRLVASLKKLKKIATFSSKYEDIIDIQRDEHGFLYRHNVILRINDGQLVTLSFMRNRDSLYEELMLRCNNSQPLLRPQLALATPRPRTGSMPLMRSRSLARPSPSMGKLDSLADNRKSMIFDIFPSSERRKSFFRRSPVPKVSEENSLSPPIEEKRSSFTLSRRRSPSIIEEPKEKEKGKRMSLLLSRRPSSQPSLDATPERTPSPPPIEDTKPALLFDSTLPIASQELVALLFPNTQPSPMQRSLTTITRDSPKRSLSIKNLLPRTQRDSFASPSHAFNLKVVGPDGFVDFSCEEERTIHQGIIIRIETRTTLLSRMRSFHLDAHFVINPVSSTHCHLMARMSRRATRSPVCSVAYGRAIIKSRIPRHLMKPKPLLSPCPVVFSELATDSSDTSDPEPQPTPLIPTKPPILTISLIFVVLTILVALLYLQDAALNDIEAKLNLQQPLTKN